MTMRKTPYLRLRYPWTDDVVSVADVQSEAADIDQALVSTSYLATSFSKFSSVVVQRAAVQNITKASFTAITFDTVQIDNGTDSPLANGAWWSAAAPTRLTAPVPCVALVTALCGYNLSGALGVNGIIETAVALNGAAGGTGVQGTKWAPNPATSNQERATCLTMWKLVAGDFLELKTYWSGTPAGPMPTDTVYAPTLALMMVALPTVP